MNIKQVPGLIGCSIVTIRVLIMIGYILRLMPQHNMSILIWGICYDIVVSGFIAPILTSAINVICSQIVIIVAEVAVCVVYYVIILTDLMYTDLTQVCQYPDLAYRILILFTIGLLTARKVTLEIANVITRPCFICVTYCSRYILFTFIMGLFYLSSIDVHNNATLTSECPVVYSNLYMIFSPICTMMLHITSLCISSSDEIKAKKYPGIYLT